MNRVYIANFGLRNSLWFVAKEHRTIVTFDDAIVHSFWHSGDREGYIDATIINSTKLGQPLPTRPTAGRWFNLMEELRYTEDDIWISRQGDSLWWTVSLPGEVKETLHPTEPPYRNGSEIVVLEKPCRVWSDCDAEGRPLRWSALHPKARDFLSTEATFQTLRNDRGYADYARALVAGKSLERWESSPLFSSKAAEAKQPGARIFSPRELAAARMADTMLNTVAQANGQLVERRNKEKTTILTKEECEALLREKMGEQEDLCALTRLPLGYDRDCSDKEMLASLDRIDSNGQYTPDNIQIVCRFVNRWKGADDDALARRLFGVLAEHFRAGQ